MERIQLNLDFANSDRQAANTKWRPKPIFDGPPVTGDELKEQGTAATLRKKASQIYRGHLEAALKCFPVRSRITVEQLTGIVGRPEIYGAHVNSVGAIINGMAKRGLISKTGKMLKPGRKERHANLIPEWEVKRYA